MLPPSLFLFHISLLRHLVLAVTWIAVTASLLLSCLHRDISSCLISQFLLFSLMEIFWAFKHLQYLIWAFKIFVFCYLCLFSLLSSAIITRKANQLLLSFLTCSFSLSSCPISTSKLFSSVFRGRGEWKPMWQIGGVWVREKLSSNRMFGRCFANQNWRTLVKSYEGRKRKPGQPSCIKYWEWSRKWHSWYKGTQ